MKVSLILAAIVILTGFIFWKDISEFVQPENKSAQTKNTKNTKKNKNNKDERTLQSPAINIIEKWDLPAQLKEVSGIAYLGNNRFACVQDEDGTIFIFNTATNKIEKEVPFAAAGDYEGITVKENTAYVVRADGTLFEVDMNAATQTANEYKTHLTVEQNIEGLVYDADNNRLLLAIKDEEPGNKNYKGIYAFDLAKKELLKEPAFKIDLDNEVLNNTSGKKKGSIMPSAIGIHPTTKEMYITDGPKAKLLIMDAAGTIKKLYNLGKAFAQPEGITFNEKGELFISNEGTKQPGNILKVEVE